MDGMYLDMGWLAVLLNWLVFEEDQQTRKSDQSLILFN
jgi:hypothetical protein